MVKIAFYVGQLDVRGTTVALYDYAHYNETILGNDSMVIIPEEGVKTSDPLAVVRVSSRFTVKTYKKITELDDLLEKEGCDILYCIKYGKNDSVFSKKIPTAVHCVFDMSQPHGDVYAGVSHAVAKKYNKNLFVPHMIGLPPSKTRDNLRKKLNIPADAVVFGRYGGMDTFNIQFCWQVILQAVVSPDKNIYFLFINTPKVIIHPRVKYLPKVTTEEEKNLFINTCDAHLECGTLGHSFGLAMGEFSVNNKPIIAYRVPGMWNTAHFDILKDNALYFKDVDEFRKIIMEFDPEKYKNKDMNCYKEFMPGKVMEIFDKVFIKPLTRPYLKQ